MMYHYLLCTLMVIQAAAKHKEKFCDYPEDSTKQCFVKEILVQQAHSPNQLAVDRSTNNLYYSFDNGLGEYVPGRLKIGNSTLMILKGIKDAFAIASDNSTGDIYFGGSHGIYKYDPALKTLKKLAISNLDIWWLVINKSVPYFIRFPSLNAFSYVNRTVKVVMPLVNQSVHQFVFDMDNNIFFINSTGLFGVKSNDDDVFLLRDYPRFLGMATDNNGYVYVCSEDGVFIINKINILNVKKIVNIQGVLGMTFDKDNNLIYSDSHEIIRLVPTKGDEYYKSITTS